MTASFLFIGHSEWRESRLGPRLQARGYQVDWCRPVLGERLPEDSGRYAGVVVFGGPQSANDAPQVPYMQHELEWIGRYVGDGGRYLGICLGGQLLARALGARVDLHPEGLNEIGYYPVWPTEHGQSIIPEGLRVYHWHKEGFELPAGAELLATGDAFPNQAFRYGPCAYGLQFHPEVTPDVARRWMESVPDHLTRPGAQSREIQEAAFECCEEPLQAWVNDFLDHWLVAPSAGAVTKMNTTSSGRPNSRSATNI